MEKEININRLVLKINVYWNIIIILNPVSLVNQPRTAIRIKTDEVIAIRKRHSVVVITEHPLCHSQYTRLGDNWKQVSATWKEIIEQMIYIDFHFCFLNLFFSLHMWSWLQIKYNITRREFLSTWSVLAPPPFPQFFMTNHYLTRCQ